MNEEDLIGKPVDDVPLIDPDGECNARRTKKNADGENIFIGYCGHTEGWGVEGESSGRCKHHGGASPGAPRGPENGSWKHGLYSDWMGEEDQEKAEKWFELGDGTRISLDEMVRMLENTILFENIRFERGADIVPEPERVQEYACPSCGTQMPEDGRRCRHPQCGYTGEPELRKEYVNLNDKAVSGRAQKLAELIRKYKDITEGQQVEISGGLEHDVNPEIPEELEDMINEVF